MVRFSLVWLFVAMSECFVFAAAVVRLSVVVRALVSASSPLFQVCLLSASCSQSASDWAILISSFLLSFCCPSLTDQFVCAAGCGGAAACGERDGRRLSLRGPASHPPAARTCACFCFCSTVSLVVCDLVVVRLFSFVSRRWYF